MAKDFSSKTEGIRNLKSWRFFPPSQLLTFSVLRDKARGKDGLLISIRKPNSD